MRRKLNEQLHRMFKLMKVDANLQEEKVPNKAELVDSNVDTFYNNLEQIDTPISQEKYGSMQYKKNVETVQIGLSLLGYDLPRFGIDGLFGPETAEAVKKFKIDNNISDDKKENNFIGPIEEMKLVQLKSTSYSHVKYDTDGTQNDSVNSALLDDLQKAGESTDIVITITTAKTGHNKETKTGNLSRHSTQTAVDIGLLNGIGSGGAYNQYTGIPEFRKLGNAIKNALVDLGYVWNKESGNPKSVLWQTDVGGNHFNHLHVSNNLGLPNNQTVSSNVDKVVITPNMIKVMIDKLKSKGITSSDLKKYLTKYDEKNQIDTSGMFTNLDMNDEQDFNLYRDMTQSYINTQTNQLNITGEMLANAAKKYYSKAYLPPELVLTQLKAEGGFSDKSSARPIRTRNPFNVGNTETGSRVMSSVQQGVDEYYKLISNNYLVGSKTPSDLLQQFKNKRGESYAVPGVYEKFLRNILPAVRRVTERVKSKNK